MIPTAGGLSCLESEAVGVRLVHADRDAGCRAFEGLVHGALLDLAGAYAALDIDDATFLAAVQVGVATGTGV